MRRAAYAALAALALLAASPSPVTAVHLESPGCREANFDIWDGPYFQGFIPLQEFLGGETITVTAAHPVVVGDEPSTVTLMVPIGDVVDTEPFPGTVTYTIPAFELTDVSWTVNSPGTTVTWTVTCHRAVHDGAGYPLAVSAAQPATEVAAPAAAAVAAEPGERTAFPLAAVGIASLAVLFQVGVWAGVTRRRRVAG